LTSAENGGPMGDPPGRPYKESIPPLASVAVPAHSMESKAPHGF